MIPLPGPDREDHELLEAETADLGFLLALFIFKLVTVIIIFWYMRTWESGLLLGATLWYWFPPLMLLAAGPVAFYYRLRTLRARREALQRPEWRLDDELPLPALNHPSGS